VNTEGRHWVVVPGVEGDFGGVLPRPCAADLDRPSRRARGHPGHQGSSSASWWSAVFAESNAGALHRAGPTRPCRSSRVTAEQLAERQRTAERDLVDAATDAEKGPRPRKELAVAKDLQARPRRFTAGR